MCPWMESQPSAASTESAVEDILYQCRNLQVTLRDTGHDCTDDEDNNEYQYEIRAFVHGCQNDSEVVITVCGSRGKESPVNSVLVFHTSFFLQPLASIFLTFSIIF